MTRMRNQGESLPELPGLLCKMRSGRYVLPTRSAGGQPPMDTDREATTKHTKGTKGIEVPRLDLL